MVNTLCLCQSIQCMPVSIKLYLMCEAGSTLYTYISHYFMFAAVKPCTPAEINVLYAWNWSIHYVWSDQYAVCLHSTSVNILDLHQSISCTPAEINVPYAWSWSIHYVWSNQYTVCLHSTSVNILGLHQSIPCTPSKSMYHMPGVGQYTKCETIRTLNWQWTPLYVYQSINQYTVQLVSPRSYRWVSCLCHQPILSLQGKGPVVTG